jgi:hypothetical protein
MTPKLDGEKWLSHGYGGSCCSRNLISPIAAAL